MAVLVKKYHPALKHGAYSSLAVLPGENFDAFKRLHQALRDELRPDGPLEEDLVETAARLLWRKRNLATFRRVAAAQGFRDKLIQHKLSQCAGPSYLPAEIQNQSDLEDQARREGDDVAREELGEVFELVDLGGTATIDGLMAELKILERMDAQIGRTLKRLGQIKCMKPVVELAASEPQTTPSPRLPQNGKSLGFRGRPFDDH
jgi:hypothetical protein